MSANDVKKVRDKIIGLYLLPGDTLECENGISLYGGAIPCFERTAGCEIVGFRLERAHFKYTRDFPPMWDVQFKFDKGRTGRQEFSNPGGDGWSKVRTIKFNHFDAQWAAHLVRDWHRKFPFKPTDNFLRDIDTIDPREE